MDQSQLFAQALPVPHPWTVTSSSLEGQSKKITLLFEAGALLLVDEMSVNAAAKILGIQDTRLGRLLRHYADKTHSEADGS
jgi:hypothetical protein